MTKQVTELLAIDGSTDKFLDIRKFILCRFSPSNHVSDSNYIKKCILKNE